MPWVMVVERWTIVGLDVALVLPCVRYNSYLRYLGLEEVDWREIGARWRRTGRTHPVLGDEALKPRSVCLGCNILKTDSNAGDEDTSMS